MKNKYKEGYYWATYKDFNSLIIVELRFTTWDNTRDEDRWVLWIGDEYVEEDEFHHYNFISYINEPEFPWGRVSINA